MTNYIRVVSGSGGLKALTNFYIRTTSGSGGLKTVTDGWIRVSSGSGGLKRFFGATATVPGQVTGLTATNFPSGRAYNNGRIYLAWSAPASDGGSPITGYFIERSTDGVSFSTLVSNTGNTTLNYDDTGLLSAQIYYYRVSAINVIGTGTASASASATATTVPQTPTITSATRVSNTQVSISFSGASGGSSITSLTFTSSPSISLSYSGTTSPRTVTGTFVQGTTYTFTMSATNANGTSGTSASSTGVVPYPASTPSAPQNLARTTGNGLSKTFTWSAPASDGGSPILYYQYSTNGGSTYSTTSSSTSQAVTYGSAGSNTFHVRAVNTTGAGTAASLSFTLPNITAGPSASSVTSSSATISWSSSFQSSYSLSVPGAPGTPFTGSTGTSVNLTGLSASTTYTPTLTISSSSAIPDTHAVTGSSFTTSGAVTPPSGVSVTLNSYGFYGNDLFYPGDTVVATVTASGTTPFTYTYLWERSALFSPSGWTTVGTNSSSLATSSPGYDNRYVRCTVTVTNSGGSSSGTSGNYFMSTAI